MIDIDRLLSLDLTDPSAALEFRRGIGSLLGWRFEPKSDGFLVWNPAGNYLYFHEKDEMPAELPPYETSVDAALTLPLDDWHGYEITVMNNGRSYARVRDFHNYVEGDKTDFQEAKITALAVTRAWLHYRRAQSAPVATARDEEDMTW